MINKKLCNRFSGIELTNKKITAHHQFAAEMVEFNKKIKDL